MFFDRYEIHIQAFGDFVEPKLIIFRSSSSTFHVFNVSAFPNFKSSKMVPTLSDIWKFSNCQILRYGNEYCEGCFDIFLHFLKYVDDKYEGYGSTTGPQKIENVGGSRNHIKSIAIGPGTLITHFGIIQNL